MLQNIYILSAADRFNYGDLLFPLIVKNELAKYNDYNYINVGIVASDITRYGALKTVSYKNIYKHQNSKQKSILIIAGGEILGANWSKLYSFIYPWFFHLYKHFPSRCCLELITQIVAGHITNPLPFTPIKQNVIENYDLIFHAVGGRNIFRHKLHKKIANVFNKSLYVTAREAKTFEAMLENIQRDKVKLTPDSAIIMSDIFKIEEEREEDYIVFQIGHYKNGKNLYLLKTQLEKACEIAEMPIYLLPLGNCPGHSDIISLKWLNRQLNCPNKLISPSSIKRIISVIANSNLFIGTSLHGIITAMSFNVPYMGIGSHDKLVDYLSSWAPTVINKAISLSEIADNINRCINIDKDILIENSENQKRKVQISFKNIVSVIENQNIVNRF